MPRTPEQNERIREQRRREILEAATALFVEHGFAATSISAIAKAAGVSHGTVFLYYPTKEELFRAALIEPLTAFEADFLESVRRAEGTPAERLYTVLQEQLQGIAQRERYLRLVHYVIGQRSQFPELMDRLAAFSQTVIRTLTPIVRAGQERGELAPGNPEQILACFFAYVQGTVLVFAAPPDDPCVWAYAAEVGFRLFGPLRPIPGKEA